MVRLGRRRQEIPDVAAEAGSAEVDAVAKVVAALRGQQTVEDVARAALDAVREAFGWAYGSVWGLDTTGLQPAMRFLADSGHVNAEFERVTLSTAFVEGQGIVGRAWRSHDLVFVRDLAEVDDCPRAPVARRAGVRSGVCFPLVWQGRVQATMDFFTTVYLEPVPSRLEALRTVGVVVSQALEAIALADVERARAEELAAVTEVLRSLTAAASEDDAVRGALDAVRAEFGWQYGSFWRIADGDSALRFAVESGSAGEEFRDVTRSASFARGVGLSGRTWASRDLVFVPDLAEVDDCVRAPAARRAGVKSGVCFPITRGGQVVATMDFFATETLDPSRERLSTLRDVGRYVSEALERISGREAGIRAASELIDSVGEVATAAREAAQLTANAVDRAAEVGHQVMALSESSVEVGGVAKVIGTIAAQTQLLALNASIEAARAGEAGKGFAVVASEVKELARVTTTATEDVAKRISAIQEQAHQATEMLRMIEQAVNEAGQVQTRITEITGEQLMVAGTLQNR